ncbi:Right-handed parallel beta-helix repeat-containing protein [Mycena sanguinolenta]|uniref:Right-handed parallel beta-helix repeat-containing protein n=1 Tax=Mycena sanguinolenta TaxID=230812 RepID=A0A8H6YJL6_9AGAR|nr:Right-handed parallel beta-helix repeat-containing protein [Mycena sanguinolenta]
MGILIDDNDPLVQYSPPKGWLREGRPPEFDNTTHASATPGDTATLVFEGTSISVYGTLTPGSEQSRLNFSIDGAVMDSVPAPIVPTTVQNQLFWKSPVLSEAQHTLVVTNDQDLNRTFFLDYFIYITTSTTGKTLLIDDTDASVTYSPGWQSENSTETCLESTRHVSSAAESWAAVSFNGTGISVIGTPSQTEFKVSIVIDGSQPITSQSQIDNQLFNTSNLPAGPHTINITVLEGNLAIDYFFVYDAGSPALATPPTGAPLAGSSKTLPIAAIVGGAIGGLALLILLLAVVLTMRRRRAADVDQSVLEYTDSMTPAPHPWDVKRGSITNMATITNDLDGGRPKNFEKERPASRYIYYDERQ